MSIRCIAACAAVAAASPDGFFFPFLSLTHDGDKSIKSHEKFARHCANFAKSEVRRHEGASEEVFVKVVSPLCKKGVDGARCAGFLTDLWSLEAMHKGHANSTDVPSIAAWCERLYAAFGKPQAAPALQHSAPLQANAPPAMLKSQNADEGHVKVKVETKMIKSPKTDKVQLKTKVEAEVPKSPKTDRGQLKVKSDPMVPKSQKVDKAQPKAMGEPVVLKSPNTNKAQQRSDPEVLKALANLESLGLGNSDAALELRKRLTGAPPQTTTVTWHTTTATPQLTTVTTTVTTTTVPTCKCIIIGDKRQCACPEGVTPPTAEELKKHIRARRLEQVAIESPAGSPDFAAAMRDLDGASHAADSLANHV